MTRFPLQVTARSPLSIRADHAEGGVKTAHYIPGTTLLGSLATGHRMLYPEKEEDFVKLFLKEQVSIPHLYPAQFKASSFRAANTPVMPLPKTAQTCKRFSGFLPVQSENTDEEPYKRCQGPDEERHGVRDTLLDWAVFSLLKQEGAATSALLAPLQGHEECQHSIDQANDKRCKLPMAHINGYYRRDATDSRQRMKARVDTRLQTRTGINREWGVVEERILYNHEVFDGGMAFWGEMILPDELADSFKHFVEEAAAEDIVRIGTGRTRGMGRVSLELGKDMKSDAGEFGRKLTRFDTELRKLARDAGVKELKPFYFAITLQSPTILCDAFLRYYKTLEAALLPTLLGLPASTWTFERVYQSVGIQRIGGWNEVWGAPRYNDYALEMGSTFLFASKQPQDTALTEALRVCEETGIGRRRSEGFGRISVSDPFHLEREQA